MSFQVIEELRSKFNEIPVLALKLHRNDVKWKRELYKNLFLISGIIFATFLAVCCSFLVIMPELFLSSRMLKFEITGVILALCLFIVSLIKMKKYITEFVVVQHVIDERKEE